MVATELFEEHHQGDVDLIRTIEVRPFNADKTRNMRGLNPDGQSRHCSHLSNIQ
jgi:hypothetical protein